MRPDLYAFFVAFAAVSIYSHIKFNAFVVIFVVRILRDMYLISLDDQTNFNKNKSINHFNRVGFIDFFLQVFYPY